MTLSGEALDFDQLVRAAGLRVTRPRVAVLQALQRRPHSETATVIEQVRTELPQVSHQAVYDVLGALTDAGLVRRIQPMGSQALYELRRGDNHHHLVCRSCSQVLDIACEVGEAPCITAREFHGFEVDEAEVIYWGTCPDCAAQELSPQQEVRN